MPLKKQKSAISTREVVNADGMRLESTADRDDAEMSGDAASGPPQWNPVEEPERECNSCST